MMTLIGKHDIANPGVGQYLRLNPTEDYLRMVITLASRTL